MRRTQSTNVARAVDAGMLKVNQSCSVLIGIFEANHIGWLDVSMIQAQLMHLEQLLLYLNQPIDGMHIKVLLLSESGTMQRAKCLRPHDQFCLAITVVPSETLINMSLQVVWLDVISVEQVLFR